MIQPFKNLFYKTRNHFFTIQYNNRQRYLQRQFQKIAENKTRESKIINKIGFYFYGENHLAHLYPIIQHLPKDTVELVTPEIGCHPDYLTKTGIKIRSSMDVLASAKKYRCLVSLYMMPPNWCKNDSKRTIHKNQQVETAYFTRLAENNVRMVYSLGALPWNTSEVMRDYDSLFVYGPFEEKLYRKEFGNTMEVHQVGYPKFDSFYNNRLPKLDCEELLNDQRKTILWLPSKGKLSSIDRYLEMMSRLCDNYNVILKPHPQEDEERLRLAEKTPIIVETSPDSAPFYKLADFVFCDYGGSSFGALYTDKPIIFLSPLNPEQDKKNYSHNSPEVELRKHFVTIEEPSTDELNEKLNDQVIWKSERAIREKIRKRYFNDNYGNAGKTAAQLLLRYLKESIKSVNRR